MPLRDRKCKICNHEESDILEKDYVELIECPKCHEKAFIILWKASNFWIADDEKHNCLNNIEASREKAHASGNNFSYKL